MFERRQPPGAATPLSTISPGGRAVASRGSGEHPVRNILIGLVVGFVSATVLTVLAAPEISPVQSVSHLIAGSAARTQAAKPTSGALLVHPTSSARRGTPTAAAETNAVA